jgi:hypothetical protein
MKAIYKKRLLTLAKFLRTVPKKRFRMSTWATGKFCGDQKEPEHNECGTAACAAGWACTIPEFQRAGLSLDESSFWGGDSLTPHYKGKEEWDALQKFFGLPDKYYDVLSDLYGSLAMPEDYLFGGDNPDDPIQAAKRIENYVKLVEGGKLK